MDQPGLIVENAGVFTTVQDLGRPGYRGFGVPVGGAADTDSFRMANALIGNAPNAAALELTTMGGSFRATAALAMAIAGATFRTRVNGSNQLRVPQSFTLEPGDVLSIDSASKGMLAYLAVAGGFQTPVILGSRSSEVRLSKGDILPAKSSRTSARRPVTTPIMLDACEQPIRVIDGADFAVPAGLLTNRWRICPQSNRIGLRLLGSDLEGYVVPDRPSAPVAPGAIQLAGGQPLIIGVAGGTMGGYPHVAHVISADQGRLAQVPLAGSLRFERVSLAEAVELDRQHRKASAQRDFWLRLAAEVNTS